MATLTLSTSDALPPHAGERVRVRGGPMDGSTPRGTAIFIHGRGASAADILGVASEIALADLLCVAPDAGGRTWYPLSFLSEIERNQPGIDSAHSVIESLIAQLVASGVPEARVALVGFSQGACLSLDHACRFPRRYGAVIALTGGIIGPPGTVWPRAGSLDGTPVFLGANDPDPHVPFARVKESAEHLKMMGAAVTVERYPMRPHAVFEEEIEIARAMLAAMMRQ
jgi:phospholipase/carboxylesterase